MKENFEKGFKWFRDRMNSIGDNLPKAVLYIRLFVALHWLDAGNLIKTKFLGLSK